MKQNSTSFSPTLAAHVRVRSHDMGFPLRGTHPWIERVRSSELATGIGFQEFFLSNCLKCRDNLRISESLNFLAPLPMWLKFLKVVYIAPEFRTRIYQQAWLYNITRLHTIFFFFSNVKGGCEMFFALICSNFLLPAKSIITTTNMKRRLRVATKFARVFST